MARLDELCIINMGQSPDSSTYNEDGNGLPFFQGNADFGVTYPVVRMWCSEPTKRAQIDDILISVRAPIGALNIANCECCIGRGLAALTVNKNSCIQKYLWYALSNKVEELNSKGTGSTFKAINKKILAETEIPLPSLDEQRKIAAVLDKVSDLIAKRRQQLDKLDELIKARFVEMFYNIDSNTNWPVVTMADISTDMRTGPFGSALHHDEFVETGIFVLGIDNAVENKFSYNRMRYITEEKYEQLKRYTVRPGDIIITIMGTVGRSAVIPDNIPKAINTKHLACLTIDRSKAQPTFICSAFQMHPEIRQQLTGQAKGAIMDGLNLTIIKKIHFKLPPIEIQDKFVEFFNITEKTKTTISKSLEKLETLKKALMQEYFG